MLDATQIFDGTFTGTPLVPTGVAITATRVSSNVLDLLTARDLGADEPLGIHVLVTQTFATLTSLTVDLEVCATAGGSFLNILSSPVLPVAQLIAGQEIFRYSLPPNQLLNAAAGVLNAPGQFIRLNYTVAGSNATAGAVFAYLNPRPDRQVFTAYPRNYTAATTSGELS
jgi:hypothetical protein